MTRAAVLTVGPSPDARADSCSNAVSERLSALPAEVSRRTVPADRRAVAETVAVLAAHTDLLVVVGGIGIGPHDVTPEAIEQVIDRLVPGMSEAMRATSARTRPEALLFRQLAGVRGHCVIIALPDEPVDALASLEVVWPALSHALVSVGASRAEHRA